MTDEILNTTQETKEIIPESDIADLILPKTDSQKNKNTKRGKKKKTMKSIATANIYVSASYNNTILTASDEQGDVVAWASAGSCGFKGPKKATPYAANVVSRVLIEKLKPLNIKEANVFVKGVGTGRESAIRAIHAGGISVISIKDVTPIPHNGCRRRKPRRI